MCLDVARPSPSRAPLQYTSAHITETSHSSARIATGALPCLYVVTPLLTPFRDAGRSRSLRICQSMCVLAFLRPISLLTPNVSCERTPAFVPTSVASPDAQRHSPDPISLPDTNPFIRSSARQLSLGHLIMFCPIPLWAPLCIPVLSRDQPVILPSILYYYRTICDLGLAG